MCLALLMMALVGAGSCLGVYVSDNCLWMKVLFADGCANECRFDLKAL